MQAKIVVILLSFGLIFLAVVVATAKFGDRVPSSSSEKISPSRLAGSSKLHVSTKESEAYPKTQSSKVITGTQDTHVSGSYRVAEKIYVPLPSVSSTTSTTKTPDEKASLDQDLIPAPSAPPQYHRRHDIGSHSPPSGPGHDPYGHQGYHEPSQEYNYHNEIPGSSSSYGPSHDTSGSAFSPGTPDFMKDLLSAFETLQRRQQQERNNENVGSTSPAPNFIYPSTTLSPQPKASDGFEKRSFDSAASSTGLPLDPNFNFDRFFHEGMRGGGPDGSYGYHSPSESSYEGPPIPQPPPPPPFPTFTNNNRGNNNRNNQKQQNPQRSGNVNQGNNQRRSDLNRQPSNHAPGRRNDHGSHGYLPRHGPHSGPHEEPHYGPTSGHDSQSNYGGNEGPYNGPAQGESSGNNKGGPSMPSSYFLPLGVPDPDNDPRARVIKEHVGNVNSEGKPFGSKMTYSFRDPKKPNNFMEVTEVKMSMNKRYDNPNGSESPSASGSSRSHSFPDFGSFRPSFHPRPPSMNGFYDDFLGDGFPDF